jgi:putative intracellular protease/amidase
MEHDMPPRPHVLIPLPSRDFDPSEAAVSWKILSGAGYEVSFATPDGTVSRGDPLMLTGEGLDLWGFIPGLKKIKLLGLISRANAEARAAYREMVSHATFNKPRPYASLDPRRYDALLLPGGHWARGMTSYLESEVLQRFVAAFFESGKPVAAICHGVVLAARSRSAATGKSVLYGRKTTALTWRLENSAWATMKFAGRFWDPDYFRTYVEKPGEPAGFAGVQAEVTRALASPSDFKDADPAAPDYFRKTSGLFRDSASDHRPAFIVRDGNYLSARWPGDVHLFAGTFAAMIANERKKEATVN